MVIVGTTETAAMVIENVEMIAGTTGGEIMIAETTTTDARAWLKSRLKTIALHLRIEPHQALNCNLTRLTLPLDQRMIAF